MINNSCCPLSRFRKPGVVCISLVLIATTAGALLTFTNKSPADLQGPNAKERQVSIIISDLLRSDHLLKRELDDEISNRAINSFLRSLDPMKVYFYQSDIDEFMTKRNQLDDFVNGGDLRFAYSVFNRLLKRIDERVALIDDLLKREYDFTQDEQIVVDRDMLEFPKTPEEALDRWRKRIKYDLLLLKIDEAAEKAEKKDAEKEEGANPVAPEGDVQVEKTPAESHQEAIDRLSRRYHSYAKRMHQFNSDDLIEMFFTSVTSAFDPHTTYMSPSSLEDFRIMMRLNLEGIGAALMATDGYTVVSKVIPGGAADLDGRLQPEDRIVSVGQDQDGEMVDVVDMNLRDVVKLIRGSAGTVVRLGVHPAGKTDTQTIAITRAKVELKESEARGEIVEDPKLGTKPDGGPLKIGVIDLPSFYMDMEAAALDIRNFKSTTVDVQKILQDFKRKKVDVVLLDLRRNGGGSLQEAINLTGLFIDQGPVVQVKDSAEVVQTYNDTNGGTDWDGPLVVLTSKFSASASEILAGAIQDYKRGIIVGDEATHGKGTVQSLLDLGKQVFRLRQNQNLGALKITMQQFYRPGGASTQKKGVVADIILPSLTSNMDVGESDLDFPVEYDQVAAANLQQLSYADPDLIAQLRVNSQKRREATEDFQKLNRNILRYREQKERKFVTLNEQKYLAERAELDADKEEEKNIKEQLGEERPVVKRNFYFDEVMTIAVDYATLLAGR